MTEKITAARTNLMPTSRHVHQSVIDARAREILRIQDGSSRSDAEWFRKKDRRTSSQDLASESQIVTTYNHRTVRPELRDIANRKLLRGLKEYQAARQMQLCIADVAELETQYRFAVPGSASAAYRVPLHRPTPQHFLRLVLSDPHVAMCLTYLSDRDTALPPDVISKLTPTTRADAAGSTDRPTSPAELARKLRRAASDLAAAFYLAALDYHIEDQRRIQLQALKIAAVVVDTAVTDSLQVINHLTVRLSATDSPMFVLRDPYVGFAARQLDQYGFPTAARVDDYNRWVAAPV